MTVWAWRPGERAREREREARRHRDLHSAELIMVEVARAQRAARVGGLLTAVAAVRRALYGTEIPSRTCPICGRGVPTVVGLPLRDG